MICSVSEIVIGQMQNQEDVDKIILNARAILAMVFSNTP
ncbi:hypothetical protein D1BOALGB6SA_56 [Olavius sp. associated proteobacterium Delta 1]|nr:hypothetical protein D1BOALGB6SA_56 [Olavius sp. associated proteobacterium Delta 1]